MPVPLSPFVPVILMTAGLLAPACRCAKAPDAVNERKVATTQEGVGPGANTGEIPTHARGMWVWSTRRRLDDPQGASNLLETCRMARLDEVYLSVNDHVLDDPRLPELMAALTEIGIRVEALTGDATWYLPEKRETVLGVVDAVGAFNTRSRARFSAIHFDIEPHQIPENRGRHGFLPALAEALKAGRERATTHGLSTSADLPRFAYEEQGALFAGAVQRNFVMLYQLREKTAPWLATQSRKVVDQTYRGAPPELRGRMVIGLRVEDYPEDLEDMLGALDGAYTDLDRRYGGWAIHDESKYRARPSRR